MDEPFAQVLDEGAVEAFHRALGLRSVGNAGAFLGTYNLAHVGQQLGGEFLSVVRGQQARRTNEADKVFEGFAYSDGVFCFELVEFDKS